MPCVCLAKYRISSFSPKHLQSVREMPGKHMNLSEQDVIQKSLCHDKTGVTIQRIQNQEIWGKLFDLQSILLNDDLP